MKKICVIGGGFFGMYIAEYLALKKHHVILVEQSKQFMRRASYVNQARVHNGYHYPRSILTSQRCHASFKKFTEEFKESIISNFEKYYMIGKILSKVTASQYKKFCDKIGIVCRSDSKILALANPKFIEAAFFTEEYAFDTDKLCNIMLDRIKAAKVDYKLNVKAKKIVKSESGLVVEFDDNSDTFNHVFNCTYSMLNRIIHDSGLEIIPLKHEMTEMALVEPPDEIKKMGITVMCGPFFSVMPFPPRGLHSFSHVRYTPHYAWYDGVESYIDADSRFDNDQKHTAWEAIRRDASRYIPCLSECVHRDSLWEVKTILPRSESDDSRPILFRPNYGLNGFHSIMGGKIDNIYDATAIIDRELAL
jgi:glycine/D-amino acid oxidase-like deaminating enzyme